MKYRHHFASCTLAAVCGISAVSASAQSTDGEASDAPAGKAPSAAKNSDQLQTVMVTATKRKEDANKVATSLSVIGGEELQAQHIGGFADMTRAVPNIAFSSGSGGNTGNGAGLSNISMRGISSSAGSSTVGIYLDDVAMSIGNFYSMGSAEPKLFDLDHVEVLRGPQGTLYGASSMGGTVKFLSNQPDLTTREAGFYAEVSRIGDGGTSYAANAVVNEVLIPGELALRVGVQRIRNSGFIDQVSPATGAMVAPDINDEKDRVLRLAMKWAPTSKLTLTPSLFYQKVATGDIDVAFLQLPDGRPLLRNQAAKRVRESGVDRLMVPSLTVSYGLDIGEVTSVTSYFQRQFDRTQDGSATLTSYLGAVIADPALAATVAALPAPIRLENQVRQVSQELRIASKPYDSAVSPLTWLAGAYAANLHTSIADNEPVPGLNRAFAAAGISPTDPNAIAYPVSVGFPGDNTYSSTARIHDQQYSIFGELNYYFMPRLHATFGLRHIRASSNLERTGSLYFNNYRDGQDGNQHSNIRTTGHKTTPKLAVTWELDGGTTLYGSASQGFRLGGADLPIPMELCGLSKPAPLAYDADTLWSYELGSKSRLLGNRLSVNASAFHVDWKNLQQQIFLSCGFLYNANVGNASSDGAEIEIQAKPMSGLTLGLAAGITHATLTDSAGAEAGLPGAVKGARLPGVPKFNASLTAQYNFNYSEELYGFVRAASRWTGSSFGGYSVLPNLQENPDYRRPAYNVVDASTGVSWDNWEVTVFVKNLADKQKIIQRPIVQASAHQAYRMTPRSVGVSLSGKL